MTNEELAGLKAWVAAWAEGNPQESPTELTLVAAGLLGVLWQAGLTIAKREAPSTAVVTAPTNTRGGSA